MHDTEQDKERKRPDTVVLLETLLKDFDLELPQDIKIQGQDPQCPSPHRIGDATTIALATLATTIKRIWNLRTNSPNDTTGEVTIKVESTIAQLMAVYLTTVNGVGCTQLLPDPGMFTLSDFYQCKDQRWVFMVMTYPHLRDIACDVLQCRFKKEDLIQATAQRNALDLEEAINEKGGTCVMVRSRDEWIASPPGSVLVDTPLISIEKIADSPVTPMPVISREAQDQGLPLQGIKVLDNTHVIAGPVSSRIAAEYGAQVLSMTTPRHMDPVAMTVETGIGKRSAWCDLTDSKAQQQFWTVLSEADVYVCNYLSLERKGYDAHSLAKHRPGLVYVDFHCWGSQGPWRDRGGFDQLACAATGFSLTEGSLHGRPSLPPTHLLNDYLAAILGTAGMLEALRRRATEGGSWRVHVNLSRICMWVQSMGLIPEEEYRDIPRPLAHVVREQSAMNVVAGKYGETRYLPTQIDFGAGVIRPRFECGAEPSGASAFAWV